MPRLSSAIHSYFMTGPRRLREQTDLNASFVSANAEQRLTVSTFKIILSEGHFGEWQIKYGAAGVNYYQFRPWHSVAGKMVNFSFVGLQTISFGIDTERVPKCGNKSTIAD